jgi:hypothetical protein
LTEGSVQAAKLAWLEDRWVIVTSDPQNIDPVTIPDAGLLAALREALNKPTGDLTLGDLRGLTSLSAPDRSIVDLRGLDLAINLTQLNLSSNQVMDFAPLASLANLEELILFGNPADLSEGSAQRAIVDKIATDTGAKVVVVEEPPSAGKRLLLWRDATGKRSLVWEVEGILQSSSDLEAWTDMPETDSPYALPENLAAATFWRIANE